MRKHFLCVFCIGFLLLVILSCKKNADADTDIQQNAVNEPLITKVKSWLDEQKTDLPTTSSARIDSLKLNLSYGEIRFEKYTGSKEFIVIPILNGFTPVNNRAKNPVNYLVLVWENGDSITKGNIIQYSSSGNRMMAPVNTFYKIFTRQDIDCSGLFTVLSITDDFRYELNFESGKLKSLAEYTKKRPAGTGSGRVNECIDWYLQTWYIWSDGSMTLFSEVYVFTTCGEDCAQPRMANGHSLRVSCSGGGNGGGGGGYNPGCTMTPQEGEDVLASITSTTLSDGGSTTEAETDPDENGEITRPVVIGRHSILYTFPGGTTAKYTLFFNGVLSKTNTNSAWKWHSLNYSQIALTEGGPPPCLSANVSAAVSVAISGDKAKASFTSTITASLTVSCLFGYVLSTKIDNINGEYPANEF